MAVTKRTRYEVLRRDNHACRYCGAAAPDVKLTVDHVTPTALGGADAPSNLVAACANCNAGKASTNPDAALVADVRDDALRFAELTRQAYSVLVERAGERDDYIEEFAQAWDYNVPDGWRGSVGRWHSMGVPIELILDAAERAQDIPRRFSGSGRFSYMCGIVWNQVSTVTEEADERLALDGCWFSESDLTDERIEAYEAGRESAWHAGRSRLVDDNAGALFGGMALEAFIDNQLHTVPAELRGNV